MTIDPIISNFEASTGKSYSDASPFCKYFITNLARKRSSVRTINVADLIVSQIRQVIPKTVDHMYLFLSLARVYYNVPLSDNLISFFDKYTIEAAVKQGMLFKNSKNSKEKDNIKEDWKLKEDPIRDDKIIKFHKEIENCLIQCGMPAAYKITSGYSNISPSEIIEKRIFRGKHISESMLFFIFCNVVNSNSSIEDDDLKNYFD